MLDAGALSMDHPAWSGAEKRLLVVSLGVVATCLAVVRMAIPRHARVLDAGDRPTLTEFESAPAAP